MDRICPRVLRIAQVMCAAFLIVVALGWARPGEARAGDPRRVWKTIETEHFVVHYYEPLFDVAKRVANSGERSHALIAPVFGHEPSDKTHIVVVDDTDGANGFASVIPRNAIRIFATVPSSASTLNDHDDWLFLLTAHEYTHILHLDSIGGLPKWINRIFGKQWSPNQIQPRWVIEGIATYQESQQTAAGRIRSAFFNSILRSTALADKPLELDAVTNGPRAWPHGNSAYLYGSHFLKYVFDRFGDDTLRGLSWSYGSNPLPYGLNVAIRRLTGHSFVALYDDWLTYLRDKYSIQVEAIERMGPREGRRLTFSENNAFPKYSKDGKSIIWRHRDGYSRTRLSAMPVGSNVGQARDYAFINRVGPFDVMADGSLIVQQTTSVRTSYSFQDLYRWDRQTGELDRLTHGVRAIEPALSPDEREVAFVLNGESRAQLAVIEVRPEAEPRVLWSGDRFDQVSEPAWSPDGQSIAFSLWRPGGYRDIAIIDVESGELRRLMNDRALDMSPVFSPRGDVVYFASDRTGIYNIYAYDLTTEAIHQVTNVVGAATTPDVSPDGERLVFQNSNYGGTSIAEIDLAPQRWTEPLPYVDDRPAPAKVPEAAITSPRPYRPLETLAPRSYAISLLTNSFGNAVNVETNGNDIVGWHSYRLAGTIGLTRRDVNVSGSYSYRRLWPDIRLAAARTASQRSGIVIDGENTRYTHDNYSLTASLGLPVLRAAYGTGQISFNYDIDWLLNTDDSFDQPDPNDMVPEFPEVDVTVASLGVSWNYSATRSYAYTIGPQEGQTLNASINVGHPGLGSDFRSLSLSYRWNLFRSLPWSDTSVLALRLSGGIRTNDRRNVNAFVLGGVPEQDLPNSVINNLRASSTGYLRGYERRSIVGTRFQLANLEYRQQLFNFERGVSTLPFYIRRLHVAGLLDVGDAWSDGFNLRDFKVGVGAALRLDMVFGYFIPGSLDIGYAQGLTGDGLGEYWMLLTGTI